MLDLNALSCSSCEKNEQNDLIGRLTQAMQAELVRYDDEINWWSLMGSTDLIGRLSRDPWRERRPGDPCRPDCYQLCHTVYLMFISGCDLKCPENPGCKPAAWGGVYVCKTQCQFSDDPYYDPKPAIEYNKLRKRILKDCGNADGVVILIGIVTGLTSLLGAVARMWRYTWWKKLTGL